MAAIKKLCLTSLFLIVSRISALQTGNVSETACESPNVTIGFSFNIGNDSFADRLWYKNSIILANRIARVVSAGSLTVESQYSGRVALSGSGGIILYNVTKTDSGSYLFIIVTDIYAEDGTATTTVNVYVNPNASCMPIIEKNSADNFTCKISDACPGKDSIQAIWDDNSVGVFTCPTRDTNTKYKCCAKGDPVTFCYSGGLCTEIECKGSGTTTTTNITVTSSSLSSTTFSATTYNTSTTPTTNGPSVSTTSSTFTSISPTTVLPCNDTNNISTSCPTGSTVSATSNISVKVIVPAVVVPCGLVIIVAIVLVVFCVRRKARKNVRERPDGMAIQDKGNNIDRWKQSFRQGKATDNLDTVYTTPDGFIINPGPAAVSTARSYKDKKYHGVTDQYSRPYPDTYGYQTVYFPSTYMSARTYAQKGKTYEGHQPASNLMANSRLAYDQTAYYPQTGYYGQSGQDVYYSGGGQHSYGQRSRSHHDYNVRKQQRDYYNQYEMADYRGDRAGYRHTKQDTAFYY